MAKRRIKDVRGGPLSTFEKVTLMGAKEAVKKTAKLLRDRMVENAGLTDHTLDELEKLGHPFAIRRPQTLHNPNFQIHKQSGRLVDNIEMVKVSDTQYAVGVDEEKVPYIRHVVRGTQFMIARDFITGSFRQIQKKLNKVFAIDVAKAVRGVKITKN